MNELWNFITGNFIDALLFTVVLGLFLLCFGSCLAAWASLRDETQYQRKSVKLEDEIAYLLAFAKERPVLADKKTEIASIIKQKMNNLLLLKHIAGKQTAKYSKYAVLYAVLLAGALSVQSWNMDNELRTHETVASREVVDGASSKSMVFNARTGASYEYLYFDDTKVYEQKILHVPSVISNGCAVVWLFVIICIRHLSKTM